MRGVRFLFLTLFILLSQNVYAASDLFTIENITVDVSDENAIKARQKAFEEAQSQAFEELATRILTESERAGFVAPDVSMISRMIQDFEVSDEKLASKRYVGTYKIRFKDRDIKRYFAKSGSEVTDIAGGRTLILPFEQSNGQSLLWSPQNQWMQAWNRAEGLNGVVPIVVPIGDLSDVQDIRDDEALIYNPRKLAEMLRRYDAKEAVVAIAQEQPDGSINIELYRTDRNRPEFVHQITQAAINGQGEQMLYTLAAAKVKAALSEDWKRKVAVKPADRGAGILHARVQFGSLSEWTQIQRGLQRISAINDVSVKAVSPREAYIELRYDGQMERLQLALQQAGLTLGAPRYLNANTAQRGLLPDTSAAPPVYDLIYSTSAPTPAVGSGYQNAAPDGLLSPRGSQDYNAQF